MEDVIFILAVLAIVLGGVTLVGHGLWLLLAAIFRGARDPGATHEEFAINRMCVRCSTTLSEGANCPICNWPDALPSDERREQVLQAVRRQISHYRQLGVINQASHRELLAALSAQPEPLAAKSNDATAQVALEESVFEIVSPETNELTKEQVLTALASNGASEATSDAPSVGAQTVSPEDRVRNYIASRAAASIEPTGPSPVIEAPRRPGFSKLFAAFLEEKNVRWGELVGGLLIVCCSIALVISFWSEIAARPLLKFCIFNGVLASLFGAGFYTERHWKIHTTSRGLLIIAILLVPLNFLAIAAFTDQSPPTDMLALAGEAISLALFTALVYAASRIVAPEAALLLTLGVMTPSLMQLLTRRFADPQASTQLLYMLAGTPVAAYLATCSLDIRRLARCSELSERAANRLFVVLGVLTYSMLLPLGLLVHKTGSFLPMLERLAPLVVLCGVPGLATGIFFWRRRDAEGLAGLQTAGIGIGVLGAAIMLGAVGLAWPTPAALLPTALINAAVFCVVALWLAIPQAYLSAGVCVILAWVVGYHVFRGNVSWTLNDHEPLARTLLSASSGNVLAPLVILLLSGAYAWKRAGRSADALWWAASAGLAAIVSLALVFGFGFARPGDPAGVTWSFVLYALAASGAAVRLNRPAAAWAASGLLLAALIQGVVFRPLAAMPAAKAWTMALLLHASIITVLAAAATRVRRSGADSLRHPLLQSALVTTTIAACVLLLGAAQLSWNTLAALLFWLAVVWLAIHVIGPWGQLITAFQVGLAAAVFCAATAQMASRSWYVAAARPWLDPWFLQAQGVALALLCVGWKGAVLVANRLLEGSGLDRTPQTWQGKLLAPRHAAGVSVRRLLEAAVVLLALALAIYAAAPGVAQELSPLDRPGLATRTVPPASSFEIRGAPHLHAAGQGGWILLTAVAAMILANLPSRPLLSALGLLAITASSCLLAATFWSSEVSVASALRWLLAAAIAIGSALLWGRNPVARKLHAWRFFPRSDAQLLQSLPSHGYGALNALIAAPYLAMMAYVAIAALRKAGGLALPQHLLVASALLFLVSGLAALLLRTVTGRRPLGMAPNFAAPPADGRSYLPAVLLVLGSAPLLVTVVFGVAAALRNHPLAGPEPGAWFRQIGWSASYGVPLVVIILTWLGTSIRERSGQYAFAAGLLTNFVATVVYLLEIAKAGRGLDGVTWVELVQVNGIVAAVVTIGWLTAVRWRQQRRSTQAADRPNAIAGALPPLLSVQVAITTAVCSLAIAPALVGLLIEPAVWSWVATAGGPLGWIAVALTGAAMALVATESAGDSTVHRRGWQLVTATGILVLAAARADTGDFLGYRALLTGAAVAGWLMSFLRLERSTVSGGMRGNAAAVRWSAWLGAAAVLIALRSLPLTLAAWWAIGGLLAMASLAGWLSWISGRRSFLWAAGPFLNVAASVWWIEYGSRSTLSVGDELVELLLVNVLAAAAACLASVMVEHRKLLPAMAVASQGRGIGFHRVATWVCIGGLLLVTLAGLASDAVGSSIDSSGVLRAAALAMTVLAAIACLWDSAVRFALVRWYCAGLVGAAMMLDALDVSGHLFGWILTLVLAAYALLTSYLWSQRHKLREMAARWGAPISASPETVPYYGQGWLVAANSVLAAAVAALAVWIELSYEAYAERIVAAYAVLAAALALAFLAKGALRSGLQYASLVLGVLFAIAFGWSWLPLPMEAAVLHRTAVAAAALTVMIPIYGFGLVKLWRTTNEWTAAAARLVPLLTSLAALLLLAVLGIEVLYFLDAGGVPIRMPALVAIAAGLIALTVAALAAALLPGRDPLGLSERGRTAYVYAAEALLGLLLLHIRITMPWLFRGWFLQFWPLAVMALAFLGVGIAEWCRRRRLRVLPEPLENTGALLPMLPVLGYWMLPSHINYSLVLLAVGSLYGVLSVLRRSFLFGIMATLAANGSLWYLLHSAEGLGLLEHPQLWLIPPAACILAAAYLNRSRLTAEQMTTIRYSAAMVIYASSTADIFVNGVGEAPWLPLVLAGLSLLGIFVGIWARVQAFLFLGLSFLVISLFTVIWYAAVELERTWIWWVSGIVTGVLIMVLFGLFEKRRDEIQRLAERIKEWEA